MVKNPPVMLKTWVRYLGWEDPLEEGMAIPMDWEAWWATVHGESQRVRHDWATKEHTHKLGKSPLLGDVDLLMARELETGPQEDFSHMLLVLLLGAQTLWFGQHGPWPLCPGAFQRHAPTCLEPRLGTACQHEDPGKGCLQGPFEHPTQTTGCMYCLQALHTRPWCGKAHSQLNWLQIYGLFLKIIV